MLPIKPVVEAPQAGMGSTAPAAVLRPGASTPTKPSVVVSGATVIPETTRIFTFVKATHPGERLVINGEIFMFPPAKLNNGGFSTAATLRTSDEKLAAEIRAYAVANPSANISEQ